jgi:hypothetical protein
MYRDFFSDGDARLHTEVSRCQTQVAAYASQIPWSWVAVRGMLHDAVSAQDVVAQRH